MIDVDVINKSIRDYVGLVTGLNTDTNVLKANQNAPTPTTPFASVLITPIASIGQDQIGYEDISPETTTNINETRDGVRQFNASINFFMASAINNAFKLQGASYESANLAFLVSNGIGYINTTDVRDLTEIDLANFEERAQIDMLFHVIDTNINEVDSVQEVDIEVNIETEQGDYQNTIEVTL